MRVTIDYNICFGHHDCTRFCPEVFEVRADGGTYFVADNQDPDEALREKVILAARACPEGAISIEE